MVKLNIKKIKLHGKRRILAELRKIGRKRTVVNIKTPKLRKLKLRRLPKEKPKIDIINAEDKFFK